MKKYKNVAVAGAALAIVSIVAGCGTTSGATSPTLGSNEIATTNNATTQNQSNSTSSTPATNSSVINTQVDSQKSSVSDMVHFSLASTQIQMIETAVRNYGGEAQPMKFGHGEKVYVPTQVPKGEQFLKAYSGGNPRATQYVELVFNNFNLTLQDTPPAAKPANMGMQKINVFKFSNGTTGTWYASKLGTGEADYYFMTSMGPTYIIFNSTLKSLSKIQIEQMASSMIFLGAHQ